MLHTGPHGCGVSHSIDGRTGPQYQLSNCQCEDRESIEKLSRNHQHDSMSEQKNNNKIRRTPFFVRLQYMFPMNLQLFSAHHLASIATSRRQFGQQLQCFLPTALQAQLTNSPSNGNPGRVEKKCQTPSKTTNSKKKQVNIYNFQMRNTMGKNH